jgi:PAS domain S-box-containing protein
MTAPLRETGIGFVGEVSWGTHLCHFFETRQDLLDALLPFFRAGLEAGEYCLWLVADPLAEEEATSALRQIVPALDHFLADGSIEIRPARDWYLAAGSLDHRVLLTAWERKLTQALSNGFAGMRANGSTAWLQEEVWRDFLAYEEKLNEWLADKRMLVVCSYPLATGSAAAVLDVAQAHNFAIAKRRGSWEVVETPEFRDAKAEIKRLNEGLQQRVAEKTAELEAVNAELRARHRQQSALADLGQAAIRATDLRALMDEAAVVAAETLGTEFSVISELLPDLDEFRVLSGVGWKAGYVGGTLHALGTPGGYLLAADEPIVINDLAADTRFAPPPILLDHAVVSLMGVIVRGRARPWGLLAVHTTRPRTFSPDEVGFLQAVADLLALAVERSEVEVAQQRERETLQAIFDNIPVMISFFDTSGRLLRVNREWERVLGWTFEEAQRTDILAEVYPDPDRQKQALEFIRRAGRDWVDFKPRTREGRFVDSSWARFRLSDGSALGFGIDITERKQAEEQRARLLDSESWARAEAEAALERLSAIHAITDAALSYLGLDDLLRELLARLRSTLQAGAVSVWLIDEERKGLHARAVDGLPLEGFAGVHLPLEAVHLDAPFRGYERPAPERDDAYGRAWSALNTSLRAGMTTPLLVEGKAIGIVGVASSNESFTEDELHLLQVVADRVAPAIERGRLDETVRAGREQLKTLSRRLLSAREAEHRRLAVELHDELGQVLTAVKINLAFLERQSGAAPAHLKDAIASVDGAMERVRDLALDLRPSVLDDLGLPAAIRWYADRFARSTHIEAHLSIDALPRLPPELEIACFRVAQEALTNVTRHARARNTWVDLHLDAGALDLRVRDDGIGFDADLARERATLGASMGLLGMQERVSLAGGEYELATRPGGGTTVGARFPLGRMPAAAP